MEQSQGFPSNWNLVAGTGPPSYTSTTVQLILGPEITASDNLWESCVPEEQICSRMEEIEGTIWQAREFGLDNLKKSQKKQKEQYDLKHAGPLYQVHGSISNLF